MGGSSNHCTQASENVLFPTVPDYGSVLYDYMSSISEKEVELDVGLTVQQYAETGLTILLPYNTSRLDLYFRIFSANPECITREEVLLMLNTSHEIMLCAAQLGTMHVPTNDVVIAAVAEDLFGQSEELVHSDFVYWFEENCPQLFEGVHQITCAILMGDQSVVSQSLGADFIECESEFGQQVAEGNGLLTSASLWLLTATLPPSYIPCCTTSDGASSALHLPLIQVCSPTGWHMLYDSNEQGMSVNRFQFHVFEYKGATVTFFSFSGHVYCVAADSEWREGRQRFGGCDMRLIQIHPKYSIMQSGIDMMYVNFSDRRAPRGVQFGKDSHTSFLSIDDGLSKVTHYGIPTDLHRMQVWGCAGILTREAQKKQKEWEKNQALKLKDSDVRLSDWRDSPDQHLLKLAGMTTDHALR